MQVSATGTWSAIAIVISTLASHTIFGLRTKVREAALLGQYTLLRKIGEGGMGIVYEARHAFLRRRTAVKLLPPEKAGGQDIARFEREVQMTAELTHPNTIAIYDYGRTPDGIFHYAMEYLDGIDLDNSSISTDRNPKVSSRASSSRSPKPSPRHTASVSSTVTSSPPTCSSASAAEPLASRRSSISGS